RWVDHLSRVVSVSGIALPVFWTSLTLVYILFYRLHVLSAPYGRIDPSIDAPKHITGLFTIDALLTGKWAAWRSAAEALILPVGDARGARVRLYSRRPLARTPRTDSRVPTRLAQCAAAADHDDRRRLRVPPRRRRPRRGDLRVARFGPLRLRRDHVERLPRGA